MNILISVLRVSVDIKISMYSCIRQNNTDAK